MTVFWRYWLLQIPGWFLLSGMLVAAHFWLGLSIDAAAVVMALWLVKDAMLYPVLAPHYELQEREAHANLVGQQAVVQQTLEPRGYVKLRGELWLAEISASDAPVPPGAQVVVESVDGLTLQVKTQ